MIKKPTINKQILEKQNEFDKKLTILKEDLNIVHDKLDYIIEQTVSNTYLTVSYTLITMGLTY